MVDVSMFPLVVTTYHGHAEREHFDQMMQAWNAIYGRGDPFVTITDTRDAHGIPDAHVRQLIAHWTRDTADVAEPLVRCNQLVITNPLIRGGMVALDWLYKPAMSRDAVGSMSVAAANCAQAMHDHSMAIAPATSQYLEPPP